MRLLVLGGTRFLGRHLVEAALARGHRVTVFTRGSTPASWGAAVEHLVGNRDPRIAPELAALGAGEWDAVVDTSGYVPRCVEAAATALAGRVGYYAFVSSLSVYADASRPGIDESAPAATLVARGVTPWTGLPLWIPATDPESAGFMHCRADRALASGLRFRPLAQTVDDTAAWLPMRPAASAWRDVLSAEKERELVEAHFRRRA